MDQTVILACSSFRDYISAAQQKMGTHHPAGKAGQGALGCAAQFLLHEEDAGCAKRRPDKRDQDSLKDAFPHGIPPLSYLERAL